MKFKKIPNTNLEVSRLCFGTMLFGNPVSHADGIRLVHWATDHGINFFDTADMYEGYDRYLGSPGGVSEAILGEALLKCREKAVVTSKVGNPVGGADYEGVGLGRKHILHQIEATLSRLRTDFVDLYLMHRPDPQTPLEESIEVMNELIKAGKIRYWGFSNFEADEIDLMVRICEENRWPRPVVSQPFYNWLYRDMESGHLPACRRFQIGVTPYRPLEGGLLTGKYRPGEPIPSDSRAREWPQMLTLQEDDNIELVLLEDEAEAAKLKQGQYAVHWLLQQPGITSVIVGVKRLGQLQELVGACRE